MNTPSQSIYVSLTHLHTPTAAPLFSILPSEICNHTFHLTLLEYDDESFPVPFDSYGYRPGHEYRKKHSLDLLATCKRVYLEAYLIPIATTTHTTWSTLDVRASIGLCSRPTASEK